MTRALVISVRLHDGRFHGAGDGPPAPARLFQALVAGAGISGPLTSDVTAALHWLEEQGPPTIAVPRMDEGQRLTNFVPSNDLDAVGGDQRRIGEIRTQKVFRPRMFNAQQPMLFAWHFDDEDDRHARRLEVLADQVYQFGRGIDFAWAWGELIESDQAKELLERYDGIVFRPATAGDGIKVSCPQRGSMQSLDDRYRAYSRRFSTVTEGRSVKQLFSQPPKPRFASVSYDSPPSRRVFELRDPETDKFVAWPLERTVQLVTTIRDSVADALRRALANQAANIERFLIGRKADGSDAGPSELRVRFIPLPSIGHHHVEREIRRLVVEVPCGCLLRADDVYWAVSKTVIEQMTDDETSQVIVLAPTDDDSMPRHFGIGASPSTQWRTVTPIALPEDSKRRRIEPARKTLEAKNATERHQEHETACRALVQAVRHAGISAQVEEVKLQREPFEAKGRRVEDFAPGTRFQKERLWHAEITFSDPIAAPVVVGCGRFLGLGLMAPAPRETTSRITTMLLVISSFDERSALPSIDDTLPLAELFHRAIVGRVGKGQRVHCPELTGKDEHGRPLRDGHRHAHVLPVDLDGDGRLDHIIVYASMGLGDAAQQAIRTLRRTWTKGGVGDLQVALAGSGDIDILRSLPAPIDQRVARLLGSLNGSRTWISATPFVPPRFLKPRGANTLIGQVNAELASRGRPLVEQCDELPRTVDTLALRHFARRRQRSGAPPPVDVGYTLRLRFAEPIVGPLMLGYGSHFGLGLFVTDA